MRVFAPRRGRGVAALPLLFVLVASLVASCSAPADDPAPWAWEPFTEQIAAAIDDATAGGASDQQEGRMTFDLAKAPDLNVIDCFNSVGGEARYEDMIRPSGLVLPGYRTSFAIDLPETLFESCETEEFRWVSEVYQMQPSSRELAGQNVMSKESVLR